MIIKLILALAIIFGIFYFKNKFYSLPKEKRKSFIFKAVLFVLAAVIVVGVATGRMHWLSAVFAAMLPLLRFGFGSVMRFLPFLIRQNNGVASFKTEYLDVKFYIQEAKFTGSIIKGLHEGKALEALSTEELDELETYYQSRDNKSYYLIRIARQRRGANQQNSSQSNSPPPFSDPAVEEALQILGLSGNPSKEEIIQAHRRLINKLHPDRGGSDFLAARVNQAKDVLLKGK